MGPLLIVLGFALSAFTAFSFYKAGSFKLKSSKESMLAACWASDVGVVRDDRY